MTEEVIHLGNETIKEETIQEESNCFQTGSLLVNQASENSFRIATFQSKSQSIKGQYILIKNVKMSLQ